jgi:hypothetical protein
MTLHCGWAIEGAIGTEFKIDANYLSPNVHITTELNQAADHYKIPLLFSGQLFDLLTDESKMFCRKIDRILLKDT